MFELAYYDSTIHRFSHHNTKVKSWLYIYIYIPSASFFCLLENQRKRFQANKRKKQKVPRKNNYRHDYADDIALLANVPVQAETLLHSLERPAPGISFHINAHKMEYMWFIQTGDISTLNGSTLKLVDKFTYLGSSVSSTETDIDTRLAKAWTANDRLSVIWKSDLTDKMKRNFFQAAIVLILLYGFTKRTEKKLDGNYTRMLRAILNHSWRQHPKKQQLYGHLPTMTKTIKIWRTRHAGHCWRSRDNLISDVLLHMNEQRQEVQLDTGCTLRICRKQWTIGRCGERVSVISTLIAWHDIYICVCVCVHVYISICLCTRVYA